MENSKILMLIIGVALTAAVFASSEVRHRDEERLQAIAAALKEYAAKNGHYPNGENWEIVRSLSHPITGIRFSLSGTDEAGNLVDASGNPYRFFFSADGRMVVTVLSKSENRIERHVLLPAVARDGR